MPTLGLFIMEHEESCIFFVLLLAHLLFSDYLIKGVEGVNEHSGLG